MEVNDVLGTHDEVRTLFRIKSLAVRKGQKLAVVGSNGCGKSTLLRILSGTAQPKEGEVSFQPGLRVSIVEQNPVFDPVQTVRKTIFDKARSPQAAAVRRYQAAAESGDAESISKAIEAMDEARAWDWEQEANRMIGELGLAGLQDRQIQTLSGGEERRVALASALVDISITDLLLLDEPTNHMSAEGCEYIQELLQSSSDLTVILVTHDRYFLDEVCDEILEIDGFGATYTHEGGWNDFLAGRAEREMARQQAVEDAKVQLKQAQAWMNRGVRGRGTKNRAQIANYYSTKEKAEAVVKADDGAPKLGSAILKGSVIGTGKAKSDSGSYFLGLMALINATVEVDGRTILSGISVNFERGMKVGIVGPNGVGKSTFLRTLAGEMELTSGKVVLGEGLKIGYLTQDPPPWSNPKQKVIELVSEMANKVIANNNPIFGEVKIINPLAASAKLLKSINFASSRWETEVGQLSGGERRRLQLLDVLAEKPNVLLLDEPTNDLDAVTVTELERLLQEWSGTVVLVSHDRALLDGVCNLHLVFSPGGGPPKVWEGSHAELMLFEKEQVEAKAALEAAKAAEAKAAVAQEQSAAAPKAPSQPRREATYKQKQDLKWVEEQITRVELDMEQVDQEIQEFASNPAKLIELSAKREALEKEQEKYMVKWEALMELM